MKIYFSAPISRVSEEIKSNYQLILNALKKQEHSVLAEHLNNKTADDIKKQTQKEALQVQQLMTKRKKQADLVIIEASTPSFGIGQEIAYSLQNNKPVIVLHLPEHKPHILQDEGQERLIIVEYTPATINEVITEAIEVARSQMDARFNFYISPEIGRYLDWASLTKKLPRAVFLRSLLEKAMKADKDFDK